MKTLDIVMIIFFVLWTVFAITYIVISKKKGKNICGCSYGCNGDCNNCNKKCKK